MKEQGGRAVISRHKSLENERVGRALSRGWLG
jgi:hypothetical protein